MISSLSQNLPEVLRNVRTRPLFLMQLKVRELLAVGATPAGFRRVGLVFGGWFEGERLSGDVLDGGSDWQTVREDGTTTLDVRLVLRTHDDALIGMRYHGFRHGPADIMERVDFGEDPDPGSYYFRIGPVFEASAARYLWINRVISLGIGRRGADGPLYSLFEVL